MYPVNFEVKCEPMDWRQEWMCHCTDTLPFLLLEATSLGAHYWKKMGVILFPYEGCHFNYSWDRKNFDRN